MPPIFPSNTMFSSSSCLHVTTAQPTSTGTVRVWISKMFQNIGDYFNDNEYLLADSAFLLSAQVVQLSKNRSAVKWIAISIMPMNEPLVFRSDGVVRVRATTVSRFLTLALHDITFNTFVQLSSIPKHFLKRRKFSLFSSFSHLRYRQI